MLCCILILLTTSLFIYRSPQGGLAKIQQKIIRARFTGTGLENIETIYVSDMRSRPAHYGGRFVFLADKTLVLTLGDSFDEREKAQDPSNTTGSLIRITDTGGIPEDNPLSVNLVSGLKPIATAIVIRRRLFMTRRMRAFMPMSMAPKGAMS